MNLYTFTTGKYQELIYDKNDFEIKKIEYEIENHYIIKQLRDGTICQELLMNGCLTTGFKLTII